jgi:hypothetical protein
MDLSKKTFFLNLDYNKIQNLRFAHAIAEAGISISIHKKDKIKFKELGFYFDMNYELYNRGDTVINFLNISHSEPRTNFGSIERNLVFPNGITVYCKKIWKEKRSKRYSFVGLVTDKRKKSLGNFIKKIKPDYNYELNQTESYLDKLYNYLFNKPNIQEITIGDFYLWSSDKGRKFPYKSWDDEYYQVLSDSEFVVCPNGDFIWTYRFFETIMCGAIPVVEDTCELYDGFKYRYMNENLENDKWSEQDAEFNFNLFIKKYVVNNYLFEKEILKINKYTDVVNL